MTDWTVFLVGFGGALAMNLVQLAELANVPRPDRPDTFRDPYYVVRFIVYPVVGGGLAYIYHSSGTTLSPILAVNVGVSAPLILKSFFAAIPSLPNKKIN